MGLRGGARKPKRIVTTPSFGGAELNHTARNANHRSLSSVVGTQLGEDITDLSLDRFFADGKLRRNLLVGFTILRAVG